MEFEKLEREIHIDASPELVFEVVSRPEHLRQWWPDDTDIEPVVGASGHVVFRSADNPDHSVPITVIEVDPPRRFSFRWDYDEDASPEKGNSMLVVFELTPVGAGTLVRMTETGFRERGWEAAVLEDAYRDHSSGWDYFVPRLGEYAERVPSR
ncbi:MAG: activator of Hsp90 ATPase 1 family protein [Microbacteriaceae bacterium]|jgi:uncharacterized protein YndB with AHSA1/START domain|nr:activator of Hsp90 ATPase 1 family protein [Microbacteriaceae bacterium]